MIGRIAARSLPLTIRENFAWNFSGKLVYAASRALILMLIAKLGSAEMVGQYALAFAVTAPVFMLADLDLRSILATDTKSKIEFGDYLGLRLFTTLLAMGVVYAIALLQGGAQTGPIILLVGVSKGIESISDMLFGLLQKNDRLDKLGISLILKGSLSVPAMGLPLLFGQSLVWGVLGTMLVYLTVMACYDIPAARPYAHIRIKADPRALWELTKLSLPLGGVLLFVSLYKNLPNYFIKAFQSVESLGYFSSIIYIMTAGSLVASSLGQCTNARLARYFSRGDTNGFKKLLVRNILFTLGTGVCMLLAAAVAGRQILTLLYRPEYAAWQNIFVLVMGAAGISYAAEVTASALTAARRFHIQFIANGGVMVVGFVLNCFLVPKMGLTGAALCIIFTSLAQLLMNLLLLFDLIRKNKAAEQNCSAGDAAACGNRLTVKKIDTICEPAVLAAWNGLLAQSGGDAVFADPALLDVWRRTIGKAYEPMLLAVYDQGEICAVFPLALTSRHFYSLITFMGYPQASHMDIACRSDCLEKAAAALLWYIQAMKGNVVVSLTGLPEGGLYRALQERLHAAHIPLLSGGAPSPVIHTNGQTYEAFYRGRFSSHALKNNRRDDRRLAMLGALTFRELNGQELPEAFALHDLRWQKKLDTSGFTSKESKEFFTALLDAGSPRWKAMALGLYQDARLVAFQYGFLCGGRALFYKSAHDDLYKLYAPGKMIKREYIRRCFQTGISTIDLGVGYEEYKAEWTDQQEERRYLSFSKNNLLSRACFIPFYLKGVLRGKLKKSRKAVLFKRNTLGLIKYCLLGKGAAEVVRRGYEMTRRYGIAYLLRTRLPKKSIELHFHDIPKMLPVKGCMCRKAMPDEVPEIALLMNCAPEKIIRRYYRQQYCYVVSTGRSIACLAWVAVNDRGILIFDCCADPRLCRKQDIVSLLQGIPSDLQRPDCSGITMQADRRNTLVMEAAQSAGFIT